MLKALAIKELRESLAIIGLGALAILWLVGNLMGWPLTPWMVFQQAATTIPFVGAGFEDFFIILGGALAIALGLKQGAGENSGNKYYYLLHRPISREMMISVKILFGFACLIFLTVVPLLVYADWAMTPGNHATPFFWEMTYSAWINCLALPSVYLGALLSGLRPARWFGSRLLPLLGTIVLVTMVLTSWSELGWVLGLIGFIAIDLVLLQLIVATTNYRDY